MTKRIKSMLALLLAAAMLAVVLISGSYVFADDESDKTNPEATIIAYSDIDLYLDDDYIGTGMLIGSTTYVPLCGFCQTVSGQEVTTEWDNDTDTADITFPGMHLVVCTSDSYFSCNDRYFYVPTGIYNINGTILIPVSEAARLFNLSVTWDKETWSIRFGTEDMQLLEPAETYYDSEDLYWLSRLITYEAGNQPLEGMIAVGNVVMNRAADPNQKFGKGIKGVIFYPGQFSVVESKAIYLDPFDGCVIAAKLCLEGYSTAGDALYFLNYHYGVSACMKTKTLVATIGDHAFFA